MFYTVVIWHMCRSTQLMNILQVWSYEPFLVFLLQIIKHSYPSRPWKWKKMDKIRHRAVICYLGVKGLTPKQVHQDMEATLGEDTPLNSMVQKWPGEFKRGRESLEDAPTRKTTQCLILSTFPFSRSRRLETANWLCLIICNRKTRNG